MRSATLLMLLCCLADGGSGGGAGAADCVPVSSRMDRQVQRHLLAELHDIQLSTSSFDESLEGPDAELTHGGGSPVCESTPEADLDFPHEPVVRVVERACACPELCSAWLCVFMCKKESERVCVCVRVRVCMCLLALTRSQL